MLRLFCDEALYKLHSQIDIFLWVTFFDTPWVNDILILILFTFLK